MVEGNGAARELFTKAYRHIFAVPTTPDQYLIDAIELAAANEGKLGQGGRRGHSGVAFISLTAVIAPLSCPETMSCLLRCAMAQVSRL